MNRRFSPSSQLKIAGLVLAGAFSWAISAKAAGGANTPEGIAFFESKIRPVLAEKCYSCHSAEAEKLKAGLQLDHIGHILAGGDTGPTIVPGKPEESLLIETIHYGNPDQQMPPKGKLDEAVIADFEKWIALGAPWPDEPKPMRAEGGVRVDGSDAVMEAFDLEKRRASHWCWQPIVRPALPSVKQADWPRAELDRFILAKLETAGLRPAEEAAPETWLRRVYFDLIGLPPTIAQIDAFLTEKKAHPGSDQAEKSVVEALLSSPHFGERWARHWMDLARYAESCGHEFDYPIPEAYRYRDYLIDAFNRDVPFDQFLTEHLAGDLLKEPRRDPVTGIDQSVVATGFWYLHEAVHAPTDIRGDEAGRIDNQIDVFSKSFLGLTVACARCHDHKFDAIATADYYSLAGYLQSSRRQEAVLDPHGKVAAAAAEAKAIRDRGQALLPNAFVGIENPAVVSKQFADYLVGAERLVKESVNQAPEVSNNTVFADFEKGYGNWTIEGEAFGDGPAKGTFKGQQHVSGFLGEGLVNSWNRSDRHTGRALSPEFKIEQSFLHFLIGGGSYPGQTCVNLLVDGMAVLTATGRNNEKLDPHTWDLAPFRGKSARLEIVDEATGGWGHVNVDHFVFSDSATFDSAPANGGALSRELAKQIATQQGLVDDSTLLHWAELLRSQAVDDPRHPLHFWKAKGSIPEKRRELEGRLARETEAFAKARSEAVVLADFKDGDADGWTVTGHSFDPRAAEALTWSPGEGGALADPAGVISSAGVSPGFHGVLRSPTFELTHERIHLRMNARAAQVRLVIDGHYMNHFHQLLLKGTILKKGDTDTGGEFRWLTMQGNLDKYVGHRVWIEVSDSDGGFVALDEVLLSNENLPAEPSPFDAGLLANLDGDTPEALAQAYGKGWAKSLRSLAGGKGGVAEAAWLNFVWKSGLWPKNPELVAAAQAMKSLPVPEPFYATAMLDGTPEDESVFIRGSHLKLGEVVPRRNLTAFGGQLAPATSSGRLELARLLVSDDNPLVRRVAVNRVWHQLFGRGIVASVDDFGVMGQAPSHPELLDWLAADFSGKQGWSVKQLIREIVLSRTYRMSSTPHPSLDHDTLAEVDPDNVLLHCAPVRRLQGEAIRDAILAVSGRLNPVVGGVSVPVNLTAFMEGRGRPGQSGPLDGDGRRSLYTEIRRNFLPPFLLTFDLPIPFNAMGRRSVSNVPAQALTLMNDPFVVEQANRWADQVSGDASRTGGEKAADLFRAAFGRLPSDAESQQIESFLASEPDAKRAWADLCHALFNKKEFIYLN